MKMVKFLVLFLTLSNTAFAGGSFICSEEAEEAVQAHNEYKTQITQQAQLLKIDEDGSQTFSVRTNLQGGDAGYEVILSSSCKVISIIELWSE